MLAALHPEQPSAPLVEALLAAGCRPVPVADAAAVADQEPAGGWSALVVELGDDPAPGLSLARRVRAQGGPPVLLVATRAQTADLPADACDDFILSPIDPGELALRLRRLRALGADEPAEEVIRFKDLELNLATYQARLGGTPIDLTYMEYELLRFFAGHPAHAVRPGFEQDLGGAPQVVAGEAGLGVAAGDDGAHGGGDGGVEPGRGPAGGVGDHPHPGVGGEAGEEGGGAVARWAVGDHHLDGPGVVLVEGGHHRVGQGGLGVEDRHHHRDQGEGGVSQSGSRRSARW